MTILQQAAELHYGAKRLGGIALGRPDLKAEKVGGDSQQMQLLMNLESGAAIDEFLADQLIPYMALAKGGFLHDPYDLFGIQKPISG